MNIEFDGGILSCYIDTTTLNTRLRLYPADNKPSELWIVNSEDRQRMIWFLEVTLVELKKTMKGDMNDCGH